MNDNLPPLPEDMLRQQSFLILSRLQSGTENVVRLDTAIAAVAAERERCAKIADTNARRNFPWGSENSDVYHAQANWAEKIAKAIRAQS